MIQCDNIVIKGSARGDSPLARATLRCVFLQETTRDESGFKAWSDSHCVVSSDKKLYTTLSLSTQVLINRYWGQNAGGQPGDGLAPHPERSSNIPSCFMLTESGLSSG